MELGPTVYKILWNDEPDIMPDPNKEENIPRLKAMRLAKVQGFKSFWNGPGKVLLERWQSKIREGVFDLLVGEIDCNCKTCNKIRELTTIIRMLTEAEIILREDEK